MLQKLLQIKIESRDGNCGHSPLCRLQKYILLFHLKEHQSVLLHSEAERLLVLVLRITLADGFLLLSLLFQPLRESDHQHTVGLISVTCCYPHFGDGLFYVRMPTGDDQKLRREHDPRTGAESEAGNDYLEEKIFITSWQEAHTIVDDAVKKGDRSVSIYISPDGGMSISVYPWPDEESLRTAYEQGKISYNDYRAKLGLPMIKT